MARAHVSLSITVINQKKNFYFSYDWVGFGAASSEQQMNASNFMVEESMALMRHRPLAVLTNEFINMFNDMRQCALVSLRQTIVEQVSGWGILSTLVSFCILFANVLDSFS